MLQTDRVTVCRPLGDNGNSVLMFHNILDAAFHRKRKPKCMYEGDKPNRMFKDTRIDIIYNVAYRRKNMHPRHTLRERVKRDVMKRMANNVFDIARIS